MACTPARQTNSVSTGRMTLRRYGRPANEADLGIRAFPDRRDLLQTIFLASSAESVGR